mmetsp:Transcript_17942/g.20101  ORF Transcript_17942/g.20101 Transcript_17942/m.20101 type:complete len:126 (-) Transcript_17942:641-1018(-)
MDADKKDEKVPCLACGTSLDRDHNGVKCSQGHDMCPDCAQSYVCNILSDPETLIPAACSLCKTELNSVQLEMQMTPDQLEVYIMYKAMKDVDPAIDHLMNCPFCKYFEIWAKTSTSNFFFCKKEG